MDKLNNELAYARANNYMTPQVIKRNADGRTPVVDEEMMRSLEKNDGFFKKYKAGEEFAENENNIVHDDYPRGGRRRKTKSQKRRRTKRRRKGKRTKRTRTTRK